MINPDGKSSQSPDSIKDIQRLILGSRYCDYEAPAMCVVDNYCENAIRSVRAWGRFWTLRLLWLPMDRDFIYVAYRLALGRAPDESGFRNFQEALAAGLTARLDIICTMLKSAEFKELGRKIVGTQIALTLRIIARLIGTIPCVVWSTGGLWRLMTCVSRNRRIESSMSNMQNELFNMQKEILAIRLSLIDTIEYLGHKKKSF